MQLLHKVEKQLRQSLCVYSVEISSHLIKTIKQIIMTNFSYIKA